MRENTALCECFVKGTVTAQGLKLPVLLSCGVTWCQSRVCNKETPNSFANVECGAVCLSEP